ncbi:Olfactory receptor Olfr180 [Microtus ochrogaster]|uniref:Olfactory receptor Olfr180 n=1 Tax=Microtus ochrogaster TaxID=79684 RepID=A0A8J6L102_MICOH|nr:Olfactory receptor Olfr180 [Microtus ochrogaster]
MEKTNQSLTREFILEGFSDIPDLKILLFLVFSVIYLVTMVGNLGLVVLIYMEHRLHTPMYIFLGNLALMDSCCSCAITPKMLENFFSVNRRISLYECMAQFYFLCVAETADCFLLAAMAYDRYVAICNPLQYHTMMSKKLSIQMSVGTFITSNLHSMIQGLFCPIPPLSSYPIQLTSRTPPPPPVSLPPSPLWRHSTSQLSLLGRWDRTRIGRAKRRAVVPLSP